MLEGRLLLKLEARQGDKLLRNLNGRFDLTIIDDDQNLSSGLVTRQIPTGTTDLEIDFTEYGLADCEFLLIESDQKITVKLESNTAPAITIAKPRRNPQGQTVDATVRRVGLFCLTTEGITKIYISNASGGPAMVRLLATDYQVT